jgi:hypothetical protein
MDRFSIGWRPELALEVFAHRDQIDAVEVIADDFLEARGSRRSSLATLGSQVPIVLHAVGLGMASTEPVDETRLEALARLVGEVEPLFWTEHLAFVRGGGHEIGHLAAPVRNGATVEGTVRNLRRATRVVGAAPAMENIATLVEPPGCSLDETSWLGAVLQAANCSLLLDLHNLHANSINFGFDPIEYLERIPIERVVQVHLAGGKWITRCERERWLDDHKNPVPTSVFQLLTRVGALAPQPLLVTLERDGRYPPFVELLEELQLARTALDQGRSQAYTRPLANSAVIEADGQPGLERCLALLYSDEAALMRFVAEPQLGCRELGFTPEETALLLKIDRTDLMIAATSYAEKRAQFTNA